MELKVGYKQTEVGVIPDDWNVSTVGEEFSIQLGKMLDSEKNVGIPKPFLGNRAIQWGRIDLTDIGLIKLTPSDLQRFRLRNGDLLVCEGGDIGRAAIWQQEIPECYYQKALHRLRPKRGYNVRLMLNVLERLSSIGLLQNFVTQTSIAHLPKDKFETVPIPHPPTAGERDAIAEALSDVSGLIESIERLIAKKRKIKQGAMRELLTGERRLPGFSKEWESTQLGELFTFKNGLNKGKEFFGQGTPIVNYMDVFQHPAIYSSMLTGRVSLTNQELSTFDVRIGDVLFTRTSETVDEVGIASVVLDEPNQTAFSGFLLRARPRNNRLCNDFKKYCFAPDYLRKQIISRASYTTRALTNGRILSAVNLLVPEPAEQLAIAEILNDIDAELAGLEDKLAKAHQIKQAMMQELLTGRTRLV
jgi:type I restriction enzyme, S subunit